MLSLRRNLVVGLLALPLFSIAAKAAGANSASWRVPPGIKKIRVRSWNPDGSKNIDRTLDVEPGALFRIDAIED